MLDSRFFKHRAGLGCMGYSWGYSLPGQLDDRASIQSLREAYDAGVRHFDTSDMYGSGHNESLVGEAFKDKDDIFIATKGGIIVDSLEPLSMHVNGSAGYLRSAIDASLQRLGRDHIELYYVHRLDSSVPIEETLSALTEAKKEGKIGAIGLSEVTYEQLDHALKVADIAAVQSELSVWTRDPLLPGEQGESVMQLCNRKGVKFVAFSPLGRGYLTGKLDTTTLASSDFRQWMPRFQEDAQARNYHIVEVLEKIAERYGAQASQVALSWIYSLGENVFAIPGSRRIEHVRSNLGAEHIELSQEEYDEITSVPLPQESRY